jgi:ComF family protein
MAHSLALDFLEDFLSLFFPPSCVACAGPLVKGETVICTGCMLEMPQTDFHTDTQNALFTKFSGRLRVEQAVALYHFSRGGRVQRLLHALKYKDRPAVGVFAGRLLGQKLLAYNFFTEIDCIVPVPLHAAGLRRRGYNQSAMFARGLSQVSGIPFSDSLQRVVPTPSQTRRSRASRWENVNAVFSAGNPEMFHKKHILLVDDVITTGATIEACGSALYAAGCESIRLACIACA